jgi:hypothetical protein
MFGQDDNQQQSDQNWQQPVEQVQPAQVPGTSTAQDSDLTAPVAQPFTPVADPTPASSPDPWQAPVPAATTDWVAPTVETVPNILTEEEPQSNASANDDLMAIKQKALTELSPLVGHLDQTPEEKFKTTMMMIQASDDQALISEAYSAAQAIPDAKVKAQALLDIVNEINYFTQHQN